MRRVSLAFSLGWIISLFAGPGSAAIFAQGPVRPPITGISHISLAAQNMDADRSFYTRTLGWKETAWPEDPHAVRFGGDPRQFVEVQPASSSGELALQHVAWATPDAEGMRRYLASKGVVVPAHISALPNGAKFFRVKDPEGNVVEFFQRGPGISTAARNLPGSLSGRIIHAGFVVRSAAAEDAFYRDILGFHLYWTGGMKQGVFDWVSMQVPNGTDWLEYMLNAKQPPTPREISVDDHFSLGVDAMDPIVAAVAARGFPPGAQHAKQMGRDGKVQLNLFDPDGVRIEFMEFKPAETPCCHAFEGRQPSAGDPE